MPISNPQPIRSGAGWRAGQQHRASQVVGGLTPSITGPAAVVLETAAAQSSATLALNAPTRVVLSSAAAVSAATLALSIYVPVVGGRFVLRNATILLNGINVSNLSHAVSFVQTKDEIDVTSFRTVGYREFMPGQASSTFTIELFADPTILTPVLWDALKAGEVPVQVSSGPTYPTWTANAIMVNLKELEGQVGDAAACTIELHSTGAVLEV